MLFQLYNAMGVGLSSLLLFPLLRYNPNFTMLPDAGDQIVFVPLALLSGLLYVGSLTFSFLAVPRVGLAVGQGVWGGTAIVISFLWGVLVDQDHVRLWLALLALFFLLLGVVGIANCDWIGAVMTRLYRGGRGSIGLLEQSTGPEALQQSAQDSSAIGDYSGDVENGGDASDGKGQFKVGLICAFCVGVCGGITLGPMSFVSNPNKGLAYLPSFALGAVLASPLVCLLWYSILAQRPVFHCRRTLLPGLLSGLIWNVGNLCSLFAIPRIGFATAQPLFQAALLVAGLWGVFVFREITRKSSIIAFFSSGVVLMMGCALLASAVTPA